MAEGLKQIKIKTGVVKRLTKEKGYYEQEAQKEEERYNKMKGDGKDEYELRKQNEVIGESKAMIPDTKNRLIKARDDLRNVLESSESLAEDAAYKEASKAIEEAGKVLEA
ncbi:tubulin-specific chaperone A-like [Mya arenaria]|uniref:tubulin-specific chaperone A-like n=1 Tax=Mya arenaria TaxID=6604 RepID=UPI0022DEC560|nr:tubulin-specific chaperone A-like [Mya arenaria]